MQGRGGTTGYDSAGALVGLEADGSEGQLKLFKETNKVYQVTDGTIEFAVNRVDGETGEFSGVFVSEQVRPAQGGRARESAAHSTCAKDSEQGLISPPVGCMQSGDGTAFLRMTV